MPYKLLIPILLLFLFSACDFSSKQNKDNVQSDTMAEIPEDGVTTGPEEPDTTSSRKYSNERFRNVTVEQVGPHQFRIEGEARIFEGRFGWVVEDGHNELKRGWASANEGAPAWGEFSFTVDVEKERPNSTLHLILFDTSAKDGSREYELPVYLY